MTTKTRTTVDHETVERETTVRVCDGCGVEDEPMQTLAVSPSLEASPESIRKFAHQARKYDEGHAVDSQAGIDRLVSRTLSLDAAGQIDVCTDCLEIFFDVSVPDDAVVLSDGDADGLSGDASDGSSEDIWSSFGSLHAAAVGAALASATLLVGFRYGPFLPVWAAVMAAAMGVLLRWEWSVVRKCF